MFEKTYKGARKNTRCRVVDIIVPILGSPKIYLFSAAIGPITLINNEAVRYISIDNEVDLLYRIVTEGENKTFVRYEYQFILYKGAKIKV